VETIIASARALLADHTDASMEELAKTAGVSRQTVYAHFPSRDLLVTAVIDAERAEGLAALEAAHLDELPAVDAVRRFLDISWELAERCPLLLEPTLARTRGPDGSDAHDLVGPHLQRIIERGQHEGDFDDALPADWLTATTFALGHAAVEEIGTGRLTTDEASDLLLRSVLRLCGAAAKPL